MGAGPPGPAVVDSPLTMKRAPLYRPKPLELIEVEWSDSYYDPNTDGPPEDYSSRVARLISVGWMVKRGKDGLVLSACRDMKEGTMRHYITIPSENVKTIRPIGGTDAATK